MLQLAASQRSPSALGQPESSRSRQSPEPARSGTGGTRYNVIRSKAAAVSPLSLLRHSGWQTAHAVVSREQQ